jgi:hypothetical protein
MYRDEQLPAASGTDYELLTRRFDHGSTHLPNLQIQPI